MKLKLGVSLLALDSKKNLNNFIKILKKEKINYLELPITKVFDNFDFNLKKFRLFKQILKKNSLKISSIQSVFFGKPDLNIFDGSKHKAILLHIKNIIKISKYLGVKNIIFGSPINRRINLKKKKQQTLVGIKIFKKIANECKKNKIIFCIEPNAKYYNCNYINSIQQAIKLVRVINSENFLINVDTGNISLENKKLVNFKKSSKLFGNFQISEKNLSRISKGNINHEKILSHFDFTKKIISLEMNNVKISDMITEVKKFKNIMYKFQTKNNEYQY